MKKSAIVIAALGCLLPFQSVSAQNSMMPEIINPSPGTDMVVMRISDNGLWGIAETAGSNDGSIAPAGGTLINIANPSANVTITHPSGLAGVSDVTNDGEIVVGECVGKPAFWKQSTKEWTQLPLPPGYILGRLTAVTPDGKIAIGNISQVNEWSFTPVAYDLTTLEIIELPGIPHVDMDNNNTGQTSVSNISADGRYLVGLVSQSYYPDVCSYIYDRNTSTYKFIGFNTPAGYDPDKPMTSKTKWTPLAENLSFIDEINISPNGKWASGFAYVTNPIPGSEFFNEYYTAYLYNVETGEFTLYNDASDSDTAGFAITNDGMVLAATPVSNPYSNFMIRHDGYYYSFDEICRQIYGFDFVKRTGYPVTGKPASVSTDGLTIAMIPSTSTSYILRLKEPLSELCERIDLLGDYTVTPASGSTFSSLSNIQLSFNRDITVAGLTKAKILDQDGKLVRESLKITAEGKKASISFRTTTLDPGKTYTVQIAAGTFSMAGDSKKTTKEINLTYTGRAEGNVQTTAIYPADGATIARLDVSSNPIILTFDSQVQLAAGAKASLFRDDEEAPFCTLDMGVSGNTVMVAPITGQYLFKGTSYRVEIPAGVITDISGSGPNDAITLNYTGSYVREITPGSQYIFNEDGNLSTNWMFYDGDQNTPTSLMSTWGFTKEYPWYSVRDKNTSNDWAMASHSMYNPAGKSDDWASTVQLYIPDDHCVLSFDSQSYLFDKQDRLKVYLLATDDIINYLTPSAVQRFRDEGTVIYDEIQSPGASEEGLEGDWKHTSISLAPYAGKSIYIAFVNENNDQSAIFLDNIRVEREIKYFIDFTSPTSVVDKESQDIAGNITIATDLQKYTSLAIELRDADNNVVDTYSASGLSLDKGDSHKFSFTKPLPLTTGEINNFSLGITLDNDASVYAGSIKNLAFEPVQRVVLEEYTGSACGNCPMGILAIENLQRIYGDRFIPITLRCYQGDVLGTGVTGLASFLGLNAAPTGRINRGEITGPMATENPENPVYSFTGQQFAGSDPTWLDAVQEEFANGTTAQIDIVPDYNKETGEVTATCTVRSALNLSSQSLSLLGIITENKLITYQENYRYTSTDPIFGEWGEGGAYGSKLVYPYETNDVARGYYGTTFNGTGGLLPADLKAGESYTANIGGPLPSNVDNPANCVFNVLLIDTNTNRIINAAAKELTEGGSVESIGAGGNSIAVKVAGGTIVVTGSGLVQASAYNTQGMRLDTAASQDAVTLEVPAGIIILEATDASGHIVRKLVVR